jgi:hypothetical protein
LRAALVARSDQFVQTLAEKLLTYALGRTVEYYDMPAVRGIVRTAADDDFSFAAVVAALVASEPFRMQRVPELGDDLETRQAAAH